MLLRPRCHKGLEAVSATLQDLQVRNDIQHPPQVIVGKLVHNGLWALGTQHFLQNKAHARAHHDVFVNCSNNEKYMRV
jgi:hypothetical protein